MIDLTATACGDLRGELLDGPGWDADRAELFCCDTSAGVLRRARIVNGRPSEVGWHRLGATPGCVAPASAGGWLVAISDGFAHLGQDGTVRPLARPKARFPFATQMNDGGCDPQGRFWAGGSAGDQRAGGGSLYRMDLDGSVVCVLSGLSAAGGIGWSPDGATMYHIDALTGQVVAYDFDGRIGWPTGRRVLVEIDPAEGTPDGLAVDDDGCLWVALFGGWQVRRYDPTGALAGVVRLPAQQPTACAFGGPGRDTLYITTARQGLDERRRAEQPDAGRVFAVEAGVSGPARAPYRGTVLRASPV